MIDTPATPALPGSDFSGLFGGLPLQAEISGFALAILFALVGIFVATVSVILVYHWRQFPFERPTFQWAERVYLFGAFVLSIVAAAGIFFTA